MTEYRWERRERKLQAKRDRIEQHGAAYKTIIVPAIAARAAAAKARAARKNAEPTPEKPPTSSPTGKKPRRQ